MHRFAVLVTGAVLLVGGGAGAAVGSPAPASAARAPAKVHRNTVWTLATGTTCQSDTFSSHHAFAAALTEGTGDGGTYRSSKAHGNKELVMTWTAGTDTGAGFSGTYDRSNATYVGSYHGGGIPVADPAPATVVGAPFGCPLIGTAVGQPTVALGTSDTDTATLTGSGGLSPTGNVTFSLCPGAGTCSAATSGAVSLGTVSLNGSGGTATATSVGYVAGAVGTYCFGASYSGDANFAAVLDTTGSGECFSVTQSAPGFSAAPSVTTTGVGSAVTDTAVVSTPANGAVPTGDVSFAVCGPSTGGTVTSCSADSATAVGSPVGLAPAPAAATYTATSASYTPTSIGTYCFVASYGGDANYAPASDAATPGQCVRVTGPGAITTAPVSSTIAVGSTDSDVATVTGTGGVTPTGTVHFYVCTAASDPCITAADGIVDLGTVAVAGSGNTATAVSPRYTPPATGSYCFLGVYSGDANYLAASDGSLSDECFTVTPDTAGAPLGLVALNKSGPHEVYASGTGQFVVAGDIFLNSDVPSQAWSGSFTDPATQAEWEWDDTIDAKTDSSIDVYGTIHSNNGTFHGEPLWPLDTCFAPDIEGNGDPGTPDPAYQAGDPATQLPANQMHCGEHGSSVNIDYDAIDPTVNQINDPLSAPGTPPNPLSPSTDIACPGSSLQRNPPLIDDPDGETQLEPGEYTVPVEITGSAVFDDCAGGYPGIYRFDQGLWIDPGPGDTVTGSNVVLAAENPYPMGGNVPGTLNGTTFTAEGPGNGAPCLPAGTETSPADGNGSAQSETSTDACSGTSPTTYGVVGYGDSTFAPDPSETGTGTNFSLIIGGDSGSTITLSGPTSGDYGNGNGSGRPGIVLYQDPNTQAN
ncbi:MAG: hypothetical protein ACRDY1_02170, partial [Acidimicrobiales bacterium]